VGYELRRIGVKIQNDSLWLGVMPLSVVKI
jgi:hypothetical protein